MRQRPTPPRLGGREAAHLLRVLAIARDRNLPLLASTAAVADLEGLKHTRRLLERVDTNEERLLDELGAALGRGPDATAADMLNALRRAGLPAAGMRQLAGWLSARAAHRHDLFRAVAYPITLMITGALVYSVLFHGLLMPFVASRFRSLFDGLGATSLPPLTRLFFGLYDVPGVALSHPLLGVLYFVAVLTVCAGLVYLGRRLPELRIAMLLPMARHYLRYDAVAGFCETVSLLLAHAVPLDEALRLACRTVVNAGVHESLHDLADRVAAGESFGECARNSRAFPGSVGWRLWSAYFRSGLQDELDAIAADCRREAAVWELRIVQSTRTGATAVAFVVLLPVAFAVTAMYLPMFTLISQIG